MNPTFTLPLTRTEFTAALRRGLGRAKLHVEMHGIAGLDDVLIDVLLHDRYWDYQSENKRHDWLYAIMRSTNDPERFESAICDALVNGDQDDWELDQLFGLALLFARDGSSRAHSAIADRSHRIARTGEPHYLRWAGTEEWVELDGLDAYLSLARQYGKQLDRNPDAWPHDWSMSMRDREVLASYRERLDVEADNDEDLARYRDFLAKRDAKSPDPGAVRRGPKEGSPKYIDNLIDKTREQIDAGQYDHGWYLLRRCGPTATPEQIERVTSLIDQEGNPKAQELLLSFLVHAPMPILDERIYRLAVDGPSGVRLIARYAIANAPDPRVGELGRSLLRGGKMYDDDRSVFSLIARNSIPSDYDLVLSALPHWRTDEELHTYIGDIDDGAFHRDPAAVPILEWIYANSPCAYCRRTYVRYLMDLDALRDEIRDECFHDGDPEVRELVG